MPTPASPRRGATIIERNRRAVALLTLALTGVVALGLSGCSAGSSSGQTKSAAQSSISTGGSTTAVANKTDGGTTEPAGSQSSADQVCAKLPVSDAQKLIVPTLSAAVPDQRLGGCTFVLPGNTLADNNLNVAFRVGSDAAGSYTDAVNGTFTIDGTSEPGATALKNSLTGVGDKAVWGSDAGYPRMAAVQGDVYCSVSTADDATKLAIIGSSNNPLPEATPAGPSVRHGRGQVVHRPIRTRALMTAPRERVGPSRRNTRQDRGHGNLERHTPTTSSPVVWEK